MAGRNASYRLHLDLEVSNRTPSTATTAITRRLTEVAAAIEKGWTAGTFTATPWHESSGTFDLSQLEVDP